MKRYLFPPNPFLCLSTIIIAQKKTLVLLWANYSVFKNYPVKYLRNICNEVWVPTTVQSTYYFQDRNISLWLTSPYSPHSSLIAALTVSIPILFLHYFQSFSLFLIRTLLYILISTVVLIITLSYPLFTIICCYYWFEHEKQGASYKQKSRTICYVL